MDTYSDLRIDRSLGEGGSPIILILSGDLDVRTAPILRNFIDKAINNGDVNLHLDLSKLSYLDSSGYVALVEANRRTRATSGSLSLTKLPQHLRDFFDMTVLEA